VPIQKRSVVAVVLFTVFTLGIYALYWMYVTAKELQTATAQSQFPPAVILVLGIFVTPVGFLLLSVECNERLNTIRSSRKMPACDNTLLWVILSLVLPIALIALIQHEINMVA